MGQKGVRLLTGYASLPAEIAGHLSRLAAGSGA
jgi:hypothetical protein